MSSGPVALLGVGAIAMFWATGTAFAQSQEPEAHATGAEDPENGEAPARTSLGQASPSSRRGAVPYELPPPFQAEAPPRPRQPEPIPDGYHAEASVRKDLVVCGSMLFGLTYTGSVVIGIAMVGLQSRSSKLTPELLFLPVVGPFALMADTGEVDTNTLLDGLAQATGMAMIVVGVAWKKTVIVPNTSARVTAVPIRLGKDGAGLALAGTF